MRLPPFSFLPPPLAAFGRWDTLIVLGYLALMALIGFLAARRKTDAVGYFLAERAMPTFAVALSVVATSLSVATFNGVPQHAFKGDCTYLVTNLGGFLAVVVVATLFIPRFYAAGTVTIYGFLGRRFGPAAVVGVSAMFLVGRLLASGVRLFAAALPLCILFYREFEPSYAHQALAIVLVGVVGTAYTVAGGIRAVIWTDTVQIVIVIGAALASLALLLHEIPLPASDIVHFLNTPGLGPHGSKLKMIDTSWDLSRNWTLWTALISGTFLSTAAYGVDHDLAQRMLTAKSAWRGGLSLLISQCISVGVVCLFLAVGLLLYIYYQQPTIMGANAPTDKIQFDLQLYPQFLIYHMPAGLAGLSIAGMLAAAQGSLDSAINAMASSAVADLYWPLRRRLGKTVDDGTHAKAPRLAVAAMGAALIAVAVLCAAFYRPEDSLLKYALGIMSYAYTGMLGVFLTALLTRRGNSASVLAALAAGVLTTVLLQERPLAWWTTLLTGGPRKLADLWWMPIGTAVSFVVCMIGTRDGRSNSFGTSLTAGREG